MAAKKTVKANTEAPVEEKVVTEVVEETTKIVEEQAPTETEETPVEETPEEVSEKEESPEEKPEDETQEPEAKTDEESAILEVSELSNEFNELKDAMNKDVNIAKPEDVTDEEIEFLKDNIEKLTELKNKTEKVVKKLSNQEFTSYWNGQSYDF